VGEVVLVPQAQKPTFWSGPEAKKVSEYDPFEGLGHHILSFWVGFSPARALQSPRAAANAAHYDLLTDRYDHERLLSRSPTRGGTMVADP
jgi:hypothetical protein